MLISKKRFNNVINKLENRILDLEQEIRVEKKYAFVSKGFKYPFYKPYTLKSGITASVPCFCA